MKGSVGMGKENSGRIKGIMVKRGLALLVAGCVLTGALAACGGDKDKEDDSSSGVSGASAVIPINTPSPTPLPTAKAVRVEVDDSLNVRESGSTEADILGVVENGDELALLTDTAQNGWYQVSYNGGTGYVSEEYVKVIDVTVERYNALKTSVAATPTPEPSEEPGASATPAPTTGTGAGTANSASSDNEDGE